MSFTIPTVADFKSQFKRDFPYAIPANGAVAVAVLTAGAVSAFNVTAGGAGYSSAPVVALATVSGDTGAGATAVAVVANGKVTGLTIVTPGSGYGQAPIVSFSGGSGDETNLKRVTDEDLEGAIFDAQFNVNPGLFASQAAFVRAFLFLAAHQLIKKLKMAAAGVQSQSAQLIESKSVADVSVDFAIPEFVRENPFLADLATTQYGQMYIQIVAPLLVGNVGVHTSYTNP